MLIRQKNRMEFSNTISLVVFILYFIKRTDSFSTGGPYYTCRNQVPAHINCTQTGPAPYRVDVSKVAAKPGTITGEHKYSVTLSSLDDSWFRGFICAVSEVKDETSHYPVGKMSLSSSSASSTADVQLLSCSRSTRDTGVTHTSNSDKNKVQFEWSVPPDFTAGQQFKLRCTMVMEFLKCWTNMQAIIIPEPATTSKNTADIISATSNSATGIVRTKNNSIAGIVNTRSNTTIGIVSTTSDKTTGIVGATSNTTTVIIGTKGNSTTGIVGAKNITIPERIGSNRAFVNPAVGTSAKSVNSGSRQIVTASNTVRSSNKISGNNNLATPNNVWESGSNIVAAPNTDVESEKVSNISKTSPDLATDITSGKNSSSNNNLEVINIQNLTGQTSTPPNPTKSAVLTSAWMHTDGKSENSTSGKTSTKPTLVNTTPIARPSTLENSGHKNWTKSAGMLLDNDDHVNVTSKH